MSLDQCGDQYALALAPDAELALSPRADDPDSWMREAAKGRHRVRPTLEAAIAFQPDVVVRYWGGDARLLARLERSGARVVTIADATEFEGVRANVRSVAEAVGGAARGEALLARMDRRLHQAAPAAAVPRRSALYLTAGGFTSGRGTLMDAILRAAGFTNAASKPGFAPVSVERIALFPPARFVLGFFDQIRGDWRGPGRHPVVRAAAKNHVAASLPAASLTCPAWFAADAAAMLGETR
ncbi:iron complex transport system substrate-binding protein [Brevundimonas alba]|uniref:Iron complex transport system substrate-binding protein n=1 Tax=Brevundimonas alba TaxID=74314 RepID=A0A7X5YMM1_9CAUL|nr:ABC transporter substrate-binding protein [Brevundimonas alba]NJC42422.1 iron complex transport system substrate-binding protein [Brevundimonas alba]